MLPNLLGLLLNDQATRTARDEKRSGRSDLQRQQSSRLIRYRDRVTSAEKLPRIAILGTGSMGGAILHGLVAPGIERESDVVVTTKSAESAKKLDALDGVRALSLENNENANAEAVRGARVVLIGVKPYMVADLLPTIADALDDEAIVVSVVAGIPTRTFESGLPEYVSVVRTMPNTPSTVGLGVTGIAGGSRASDDDVALVERVFSTVGETILVDESKIDALSAFSGSGPAFVFYLIEQYVEAAIAKGFTPEQAETMIEGTFRGASELLARSDGDAKELRKKVTSPKGTTEKAVEVLQGANLAGLFGRAADAAIARAEEIARGE